MINSVSDDPSVLDNVNETLSKIKSTYLNSFILIKDDSTKTDSFYNIIDIKYSNDDATFLCKKFSKSYYNNNLTFTFCAETCIVVNINDLLSDAELYFHKIDYENFLKPFTMCCDDIQKIFIDSLPDSK